MADAPLRSLVDNLLNVMVYQIDSGTNGEERRFTYLSRGVMALHEVSVEEAQADPMLIYGQVFPQDLAELVEKERIAARTSVPLRAELRLRLPSGRTCWRSFTSAPRRLPDGRLVWDGIELDVSERVQSEVALRSSEERYRVLAEAAPQMIYLVDRELRVQYVNPLAARYLGMAADDVVGKQLDELFPAELVARHRVAIGQVFESGVTTFSELEERFPSGRIWIEARLSPLRNDHGQTVAVIGLSSDITERKRMEEALQKSEERFELTLQALNDGVWDWDLTTNAAYFDARYYTISGYEPNEFPHRFEEFVKRIHTDDRRIVHEAVHEHFAGRIPTFDVEFRFLRKDGTYHWIRGRGRIVSRNESGEVIRMVGTHTDITDRKAAEEEREKLREQLLQSQKMESIGRLAGGIAHDFNNMLSVILGRAEMSIGRLSPDDPTRTELLQVREAAERSATLTRQLLAFARKQPIAPQVLDLNRTVEGMIDMLRPCIGEDIELTWMPSHPACFVRMDPSQMDQVLTNLCLNARDAIPGTGTITIRVCAHDCESGCIQTGACALLAVSDSGCGMDRDTLEHIFEPFFTTKEGMGTGLGLATVYGIVQQNGGFIEVDSVPGGGSTFRIHLPCCEENLALVQEEKQEVKVEKSSGAKVVLLVEDEPMIRAIIQKMLDVLGYHVLVAATPGEAMQLVRSNEGRIDLLMTDVVMPGMNGRELAARLLPLCPSMKRLFISGYTADVIAEGGVIPPGVHFLQKPFKMSTLIAKINEVLGDT